MQRGYTLLWRRIWNNPVLHETNKRFSKFEAFLYLVNVMAAGMDDEETGVKRGEFSASVTDLSRAWNWGRGSVERFMDELEENSMISRVVQQAVRKVGHFIVCNYDTYNQKRYANRYDKRYTPIHYSKKKEEKNIGESTPKPLKRSKKAPSEFTVNDEMRVWASKETPGIDIEAETAKFMDYEFKDAKSDWLAAWRNWMRNAMKWNTGRSNGGSHYETVEEHNRRIAEEVRKRHEQSGAILAKPVGSLF